MKALLAILIALCGILSASSIVLADDKGKTSVFNVNSYPVFYDSVSLSKLQMPKNLPSDYVGLTHSIYQSSVSPNRIINKCDDVDPDCLSREQKYSRGWICRALDPRLIGIMPLKENHQFRQPFSVARILPARFAAEKDEALFLHYSQNIGGIDNFDVQVIDWRDLSILLSCPGMSKMSVEHIVSEYVSASLWCYASGGYTVTYVDLGGGRSYGKVIFNGRAADVFAPIEWYREGDAILFVFEKVGLPLVDLIERAPDPEACYGGMPYEDPRPFLRFEKSNRRQIAEEHLKAKAEKKSKS